MLALTYPDGARVQRCDYLPENPSKSDYASRFVRRLRRGIIRRKIIKESVDNVGKNEAELFLPQVITTSSITPLRADILHTSSSLNGNEFRCDKTTDYYEDEVDSGHQFRPSSQPHDTVKKSDDDYKFSVFNLEEKCPKTMSKFDKRRRELPGRESWPGGRHPKDRCFLHLILILVLIIIGSNRHCGFIGSRVNRTAFSLFAFGTVFAGRAGCAPVDIITDAGVRAERSANLSHITGTSRKIQMYIKHRHLQILPDGTVNGSNDDTSDFTILQRTSVSRGQLRIQGVATCLYLCMDSCGILYGSREYTEDCVFNETLEQHNYNTYSSAHWSTPKKTMYLGLSGRGQPRRVQAKGHNLGRLSAYARVLTQVVAQDRVESLHRRMSGIRHNVRHHHGSQQTICPSPKPQEKDGRDKFRCRKRKKRKKRRRKCKTGEIPGAQCDNRENGEAQSKRSCEGAALDEACRKEALDAPAKKRKSRIEDEEFIHDVEDDAQDDDVVPEGKSRRSNNNNNNNNNDNNNNKKRGKRPGGGGAKKKKNGGSGSKVQERNLGKNLKKLRGQSHTSGRFTRTTNYRVNVAGGDSTPAMSSPIFNHPETTSPTTLVDKRGDERSFEPSISSSSSSAVSAVSLAATSLASTLTLTVGAGSGEVLTEFDNVGKNSGGGVFDTLQDDLKDFPDEDEDDEVDEDEERDETSRNDRFGKSQDNTGKKADSMDGRLAM